VEQHQRNGGFNLPLAVCIPVATRRRNEAVREAAMRFPVRRSCRASAFQSIPLEYLLTNTLFMQSYGATLDGLKQPFFAANRVAAVQAILFCASFCARVSWVLETRANIDRNR
jgi:hypothetical protein